MAKSQYYTQTFTLPNGKRKYVRAKTKEELDKKVFELRLEMNAGVDISNDMRFDEFVQMWWKIYQLPVLRPSSVNSVRMLVNIVLDHLGALPIRQIKPIHIQNMLQALYKEGYAKGTQKHVLSKAKQILNCAVENNIIMRNPVLSSHKVSGLTKKVEALTVEQEIIFREAIKGRPLEKLAILALNTGMRSGELRGLQWADVDMKNKVIHVQHNLVIDDTGHPVLTNTLKTEAARRDIPITPEAYSVLASIPKVSTFIFINRYNEPITGSVLACYFATLDKTLGFAVRPHMLRHTFATRLIANGADPKTVQYLLGHATLDMTLSVYTSYNAESPDTQRRTAEMLVSALS